MDLAEISTLLGYVVASKVLSSRLTVLFRQPFLRVPGRLLPVMEDGRCFNFCC